MCFVSLMWSCLGYTRPALNRTGLWFGNSEIWRLVNLVCTVEEFLTKRIRFVSHEKIKQRARITKLDYLWPHFGSFMRSPITHPYQLLLFRGSLNKIPAMKGTQTFLLTLQMQRHLSGLTRIGATYLIFVTSTKHRVHVYTMFMSRMYLGIWEESCIFWYMYESVINISTYQKMDEIPQALDKAQHFFHTGNRQNLLLEYPGWAVRAGEYFRSYLSLCLSLSLYL